MACAQHPPRASYPEDILNNAYYLDNVQYDFTVSLKTYRAVSFGLQYGQATCYLALRKVITVGFIGGAYAMHCGEQARHSG